MYSHIASCLVVPQEDREAAAVAGNLERQHRRLAIDDKAVAAGPGVVLGPMDALVSRNYSVKQSQDFETDLLKWMLFSSIAYNLLESALFRSFVRKWIPGIKSIPTRHAMSSTVLERLLGSLSTDIKTVYSQGAFVSLSFDGWKSGGGRKLIGVLAGLVSKNTGQVSVDFRGTSDITALAETSELVVSKVELELERARADNDYLPPNPDGTTNAACGSVHAGIVSDSASCNVAAKISMSEMFPSVIMVACMAHQLNLLTANVITHPALKAVTRSGGVVVKLFTQSTKWMGQLEICMDQVLGFRRMLIKRGETRWYSHFGMVKRILLLKPALEAFADKFNADRSLRSTANGSKVLDLLRSFRFWEQMETMSRLLRRVVIEIGMMERQSANLSDVCAAFGRLYAYFKSLKEETAAVSSTGITIAPMFAVAADPSVTALTHQVSGSALGFLQWRLNKYYDTSLLFLAHILDPSRHLSGLQTSAGGVAERGNVLRLFLSLAARFGLPGEYPNDKVAADVAAASTIQAFSTCLDGGNNALLAFKLAPDGRHRITAVRMWRLCQEFSSSLLPKVAQRLLSVPAHAAELERVRSGMALANTPIRYRLSTDKLTATTQINIHLRAQLDVAAGARLTYQPGCFVPDAVTAGPRSRDASSAEQDEDDHADEAGMTTLDADAGDMEHTHVDLDNICTELTAILSEEEQVMAGGCGAESVERPLQRETDADAAAAELLRVVRGFVRGGVRGEVVSGEVTGALPSGESPGWSADNTTLLRDIFDISWYLADAKKVYRV